MPTVTIPQKNNINRQSGSLVLKIEATEKPTVAHLLSTGAFSLWYKDSAFVLQTHATDMTKRLTLPMAAFPGEVVLLWTWLGSNHRLFAIGETIVDIAAESSNLTEDFGIISLAVEPYFTGTYCSLEIYASDLFYNSTSEIESTIDGYMRLLAEKRLAEETFYVVSDTPKNNGKELVAGSGLLFSADYTEAVHYAKKPFLEATLAPRDHSPILVSDETGPLQRQYFFDKETGIYGETNTETFLYRGEDVLYLAYEALDANYHVMVRCEDVTIGGPVSVDGNAVFLTLSDLEKDYFYGKEITVTYRLARSYTVEPNENAAFDSYIVRLENHENKAITITQEGNRFSNQKLAREIELNPIVNPQHTGFLYISKEEQRGQAFRLNLSSNYLVANGLDSADFLVEVIDQDGNEVLSPYVDVFILDSQGKETDALGRFAPIINKDTLKARNAAGRCYFRFQAPLIRKADVASTQKIYVVAYDRKDKIGAQIPLILRPSTSAYVEKGGGTGAVSLTASIVFEYFARHYEKSIPTGHPILLCDFDRDGVLGQADLERLLIEQTNETRMQAIATALRAQEVF